MAVEEFTFLFDEVGLEQLFRSPDGATARDLARRAIRVESEAKANWNTFPPSSPPGSKPAVRTDRLRASITWQLGVDSIGLFAEIGSPVEYAAYVEYGTDRMAARPFLRPALRAAL